MINILKAFLDFLHDVLATLIEGSFDALGDLFVKKRKTEYDAHFSDVSAFLSKSQKQGFCLDGKGCVSLETATKNALVIGKSGNFKSSGILIPSILRMRGGSSLVITDFSTELLQKTSGALLKADYDVKVISFGTPTESEGYNPLKRMRDFSEVQKLSKMIIITALGTGSKDPFWNLAAEGLLNFTIRLIIKHCPAEFHTLYTAYNFISSLAFEPDKLDAFIAWINDPDMLAEYKTFITYDRMLPSIVATCRAALAVFATDPNVALTTSHDTLDFSEFRKRKTAVFLTTNTKDMRYYSLAVSLFLEQLTGHIMSKLPTSELPLFFLIDEASSLYFSNLELTISNIRKYGCGILQVYQSAAQLVDRYNPSIAKSLTENSFSRIYMPGQSLGVAQEIESSIGKFEWEDTDGKKHVRSLMTASEVRETDNALIFIGNAPVISTPIVPYFKQSKLLKLSQLPPYQPSNKLPFQTPPKFPLA